MEKELIRVACLLQSLLRDVGLMKETMGHLEDERHSAQARDVERMAMDRARKSRNI